MKLIIVYTPSFVRQFRTLEPQLQEEVIEKIELFKNLKNHKPLKVHKLSSRLRGRFSFTVNYKICIVFSYLSNKEVVLLAIGGHDMYK